MKISILFIVFLLFLFLSSRITKKTRRCVQILNIPNDCSAHGDYSYMFWAVYELRLASYGLKTVSNTLRVLLRTYGKPSVTKCNLPRRRRSLETSTSVGDVDVCAETSTSAWRRRRLCGDVDVCVETSTSIVCHTHLCPRVYVNGIRYVQKWHRGKGQMWTTKYTVCHCDGFRLIKHIHGLAIRI